GHGIGLRRTSGPTLRARAPRPVLETWRWRSFHQLRGKGPQAMTSSSDGVIWFGADDGIVRYDGIE
ncbi:MAG: hypothetical protein VYB08_20345, partial [Candidatus Latescibacterota bacterium]|nr:hypothetical protein [Candidatus Latescibacterota bacterium]